MFLEVKSKMFVIVRHKTNKFKMPSLSRSRRYLRKEISHWHGTNRIPVPIYYIVFTVIILKDQHWYLNISTGYNWCMLPVSNYYKGLTLVLWKYYHGLTLLPVYNNYKGLITWYLYTVIWQGWYRVLVYIYYPGLISEWSFCWTVVCLSALSLPLPNQLNSWDILSK